MLAVEADLEDHQEAAAAAAGSAALLCVPLSRSLAPSPLLLVEHLTDAELHTATTVLSVGWIWDCAELAVVALALTRDGLHRIPSLLHAGLAAAL